MEIISMNKPGKKKKYDTDYSTLSPSSSGGNSTLSVKARAITAERLREYIATIFEDLRYFCARGSPLVFVNIAAFSDFLCCSTMNGESDKQQLRLFFDSMHGASGGVSPDDHICRIYRANKLTGNTLVEIFRNGLVHNFSTNPPSWGTKVEKGQVYEVFLMHRASSQGKRHLQVDDGKILHLVAEDMIEVLECYARYSLEDAHLLKNILSWCNAHPPVADF
jgi:hypothetical protein